MARKTVDIHELIARFNALYEFLYDSDVAGRHVTGYEDGMRNGDRIMRANKALVEAFVEARGDFIASDREVAAFGIACADLKAA